MKGLMEGIDEGHYDLALGAISITPNREQLVDFTHAVNPSGTGIAMAREEVSSSFLRKWGPIIIDLLQLMATLLLMLLISAAIVYLIERKYAEGTKDPDRYISSIADGLWWSAVTMTTVGYGDKVPRSRAGKMLGIVWIFISIIFFSLFTANASAKLSENNIESVMNTLDDLRDARVVAVGKSSGAEFLLRENIPFTNYSTIEEAINAVLAGTADAVVSNVPVLKYHNKSSFHNQLLISDNFLLRNNMGIALPTGRSLAEPINQVLLEKISEPKWQYAVYKYIGD
ncbi:MAG: transporter substrate-binding domain-containing protein, partial [Bacteroidota bacterium]